MAEIKELSQVTVLPGIRRDGTMIDGDFYSDGQWVRFMRGRPRKMGGFRVATNALAGPVRTVIVWSRGVMNMVYFFSGAGVQVMLIDNNGVGSVIYDRTPVGFIPDDDWIWSVDTMYDDAAGSKGTIIIAVATKSLENIDNDVPQQVYWGLITETTTPLSDISGLLVSGGVCCSPPYLIYYGSDGSVGWSDANQPQTLNTGDAGQDRVTGAKIVKGLPVRGANGPSALLWTLDSLISMQYVGGGAIFRFTTITNQSSILAQNSVIEYDGSFFWIGVDRFLAFSGGQVQEVPNQNNLNWFFEGLNFEQRQKVWVMKIPRFGEIWWFYPRGDATECTHAVIFNVREKTWYDCELTRSAGFYSQVFQYPVMTSSEFNGIDVFMDVGIDSGTFQKGDKIKGISSGALGDIVQVFGTGKLQVKLSNAKRQFIVLEGITNLTRSGTGTLLNSSKLYACFVHEKGLNYVDGDDELAIPSFFETSDFGLPTGGSGTQNPGKGLNRWTRLVRIEPDFVQEGNMTVEVVGREFPSTEDTVSEPFTFDSNTGKIDLREQRRLIRLRFTSNELGGFYEMGRTILHTEPGDVRS